VASLRYVVADVFTDTPLTGNQLAVFTDGREVDDATMQALARELKFSETVFVLPASEDGHARIRIFTPSTELPFAGHPVLGSAFVLGAPLQLGEIRLETGSGVVPVVLERENGRIRFGWMSQPVPGWEPFAQADELLALLGVGSSALPVEVYDLGPTHAYVALESENAVAGLEPDFAALGRLTDVCVNCFAGSDARWKTRMFALTRILRPGRQPGRSRSISRATAESPSATRSRSRRASKSPGRRRSTRASSAKATGSTKWRSAALPSSSPAASSVSDAMPGQAEGLTLVPAMQGSDHPV
jgi:trans-2,3-dihydro-3-hydroxyanthranilate isomerase